MRKITLFVFTFFAAFVVACSQPVSVQQAPSSPIAGSEANGEITPAAELIDTYLPLLKNKRVAVFANNTSMVKNTHLVDTLKSLRCGYQENICARAWIQRYGRCR